MLFHLEGCSGIARKRILFVSREMINVIVTCFNTALSENIHLSFLMNLCVVFSWKHLKGLTNRRSSTTYKSCKRFGDMEYNEIDKCMRNRKQVRNWRGSKL